MVLCKKCGAELGKAYRFCIECGKKIEQEKYTVMCDGLVENNNCEIGITPTSIKLGVVGIPINVCRNWDAAKAVRGILCYADITDQITVSPKHIFETKNGLLRARAWQFTINNNNHHAQLKQDGANTLIAAKDIDEKLICEIEYRFENKEEFVKINVLDVKKTEDTPATELIRKMLRQQILVPTVKDSPDDGVHWGQPSRWINIDELEDYDSISRCLYMWWGSSIDGNPKKYLYIGIVGDVRGKKKQEGGISKRNLTQRIREEVKQYAHKGVRVEQFRFDPLLSSDYDDIPEILKTAEMRAITALSAVLPCASVQKQITPILSQCELELINARTSYHSNP